jgi:hypothetical protein
MTNAIACPREGGGGTTTLFAALDVLEGKVIGRCMQRHRHQEFIRFLNAVERAVPAGKAVHVVLDNYATTSIQRACPREGGGRRLAAAASALHLPFHPDFLLLGQRRRGLVRQAYPATPQTRRFHLDR